MKTDHPWRMLVLMVKAGSLSALLMTVVSAGVIAAFDFLAAAAYRSVGHTAVPGALDFVKTVILLTPITVVVCGIYSFFAAMLGSFWFYVRRHHAQETRRLLFQAGALTFLLAWAVVLLDSLLSPHPVIHAWSPVRVLSCVVLSVPCGCICALVLRGHMKDATRGI